MNLVTGFSDTFSILALKWNGIRKIRTKIVFLGVFVVGLLMLYGITNIGSFILIAATNDSGFVSAQLQSYATAYLNSFANNQLNVFVSGVLGATVATVLITPFSGYSLGGIVSTRDLSIVKANDNYKLSDSIIVQSLSSLSIIQLFSLTILSSLLTIQGASGPGIIFGWLSWIIITFFSVAFMWCIEYANRKFGKKTKIATMASLVLAVGLAILFDPFHGTTFFGLSPLYIHIVQTVGTGNLITNISYYGGAALLLLFFAGVINFVGSRTLTLQEPIALKTKKDNKVSLLSSGSTLNFSQLMRIIVFRYKVIWRPMLITSIFSAIFLAGIGNATGSTILASFVIITPLIVSMSFGVNLFGVLGSSNIWLISQPYWRETALRRLATLQLGIIAIGYFILLFPALVLGRISFENIFQAAPGYISAAIFMTVFAVGKSLKKPVKYVPSTRGDAILPPTTMLSYIFQLILSGGIVGAAVFYITPALTQWEACGAVAVICLFWFYTLNRRWNQNEKYINAVVEATTGD